MERLNIKRKSAKFIRAVDDPNDLKSWFAQNQHAIGVAMVGRSNVGKSSLINTMFGNKTAKTSKTPGRTQKINIFTFQLEDDLEQTYYLYDLPGYGFAKVSKDMLRNWQQLMRTFFISMTSTTLLLNLQDARNPDQKSDQAFHDFVNTEQLEVYLVFNKIDKLKKQKEKAALNKLKPSLYKRYKKLKQIFFVSAESKEGVEALENSVISYLKKMLLIPH